jgi:superfamily II DNA or RNA helicase
MRIVLYYEHIILLGGIPFWGQERSTWSPEQSERFQNNWAQAMGILNAFEEEDETSLYVYQRRAITLLKEHFESGDLHGALVFPTGYGKMYILAEFLQLTGLRALVLEPTRVLVEEASESISEVTEDSIPVSKIVGSERDDSGQIVVSTYSGAMRGLEAERLGSADFDIVIADEAHHLLSPKMSKIVKERFVDKDIPVIGFTATEAYSDSRSLESYLGKTIDRISLLEAIEAGLLCPYHNYLVHLNNQALDLSDIKISSTGEYDDEELDQYLFNQGVYAVAAESYLSHFNGDQGFVFCNGIRTGKRIGKIFQEKGIRAVAISSRTSPLEFQQALEKFEDGEINVLISDRVIREGYHSERARTVFDLTFTRSPLRKLQNCGRVFGPDKDDVNIVEFLSQDKRGTLLFFEAARRGAEDEFDIDRALKFNKLKRIYPDRSGNDVEYYVEDIGALKPQSRIAVMERLGINSGVEAAVLTYEEVARIILGRYPNLGISSNTIRSQITSFVQSNPEFPVNFGVHENDLEVLINALASEHGYDSRLEKPDERGFYSEMSIGEMQRLIEERRGAPINYEEVINYIDSLGRSYGIWETNRGFFREGVDRVTGRKEVLLFSKEIAEVVVYELSKHPIAEVIGCGDWETALALTSNLESLGINVSNKILAELLYGFDQALRTFGFQTIYTRQDYLAGTDPNLRFYMIDGIKNLTRYNLDWLPDFVLYLSNYLGIFSDGSLMIRGSLDSLLVKNRHAILGRIDEGGTSLSENQVAVLRAFYRTEEKWDGSFSYIVYPTISELCARFGLRRKALRARLRRIRTKLEDDEILVRHL